MKKVTVALLLAFCALLSSCKGYDEVYKEYHGLDQFKGTGKCPNCVPYPTLNSEISKSFLKEFSYTDGDYVHICNHPDEGLEVKEGYFHKTVLWLTYGDDETYGEAKQYLFEHYDLSAESVAEYNNYSFYDLFWSKEYFAYPYNFRRLAYNDQNKTLVFLAFSISANYSYEFYQANYDFPTILEVYFGDLYDFSA